MEPRAIRLPRTRASPPRARVARGSTAAEVTPGSAKAPDALGLGHEDAGPGPFAVERGHDRDRAPAVGGRERRPEPLRRAPIQPLRRTRPWSRRTRGPSRRHPTTARSREAPGTRSGRGQRRLADRLHLHGAAPERAGEPLAIVRRAAAPPPSGAWSLESPRASRAPRISPRSVRRRASRRTSRVIGKSPRPTGSPRAHHASPRQEVVEPAPVPAQPRRRQADPERDAPPRSSPGHRPSARR